MRLARVRIGTDVVAVIIDDTDICHILASSGSVDPLLVLLQDARGLVKAARSVQTDGSLQLNEAALVSPLHRPGKIIGVGLNYLDHTAETGMAAPTRPLTFAKYPSSLTGPYDEILVPRHQTSQVDYEGELAVVIGKACPPDGSATLENVAALTVANDVSARDVQFSDQQWTRGKSFDTFTPLGPWLVTTDVIPDPQRLHIWTSVNGERTQDDNTSSMVFDISAILAHVSAGTSLEPGDIVLTGTPSGAGAFREPPRFLGDGDVVEIGVEGVGLLRNYVRFLP